MILACRSRVIQHAQNGLVAERILKTGQVSSWRMQFRRGIAPEQAAVGSRLPLTVCCERLQHSPLQQGRLLLCTQYDLSEDFSTGVMGATLLKRVRLGSGSSDYMHFLAYWRRLVSSGVKAAAPRSGVPPNARFASRPR